MQMQSYLVDFQIDDSGRADMGMYIDATSYADAQAKGNVEARKLSADLDASVKVVFINLNYLKEAIATR